MTLAEMLSPFGVSEEEYLAELAEALGSAPGPAAGALSGPEQEVLARWSGVGMPGTEPNQAARALLHNISANLAEQLTGSLSADETAVLLGISSSRVRHRVHEGGLYAFKTANQLRLPRWQFHEDRPLPGLSKVLNALGSDLHPLEVAGFMTSPDDDLVITDEAVTPRAWLISGGDPAVVVHLAALVGAGW